MWKKLLGWFWKQRNHFTFPPALSGDCTCSSLSRTLGVAITFIFDIWLTISHISLLFNLHFQWLVIFSCMHTDHLFIFYKMPLQIFYPFSWVLFLSSYWVLRISTGYPLWSECIFCVTQFLHMSHGAQDVCSL